MSPLTTKAESLKFESKTNEAQLEDPKVKKSSRRSSRRWKTKKANNGQKSGKSKQNGKEEQRKAQKSKKSSKHNKSSKSTLPLKSTP
jgi:hypothetical protein